MEQGVYNFGAKILAPSFLGMAPSVLGMVPSVLGMAPSILGMAPSYLQTHDFWNGTEIVYGQWNTIWKIMKVMSEF